MTRRILIAMTLVGILCAGALPAQDNAPPARVVDVANAGALHRALTNVTPGTTIRVAPGSYAGGFYLGNVEGTLEAPIVVTGADPADPPVFAGFAEGAKLTRVAYVRLAHLEFRGFDRNGVNVDDGGRESAPSHHLVFENLRIIDTGVRGNHDALKLSGVRDFVVSGCRFEAWGGSGIDIVGCHNGIVEDCRFVGREGIRQKTGVQIKGGSTKILVQACWFRNAGERCVTIGGSTGRDFFRPGDATYEAADIIVAGNRFVGGEAAVAWVSAQRGYVHHNIIYLPERWALRILQEGTGVRACANGIFEANLVVCDNRVKAPLNIGERTSPVSFTFRRNAWFRLDSNEYPELPTVERDGVYQVWPALENEGTETMRIASTDTRFEGIGPNAYARWPKPDAFADVTVAEIPRVEPPKRPFDYRTWTTVAGVIAAALLVLLFRLVRRLLRRRRRRRTREEEKAWAKLRRNHD